MKNKKNKEQIYYMAINEHNVWMLHTISIDKHDATQKMMNQIFDTGCSVAQVHLQMKKFRIAEVRIQEV